MMTPAIPKYRKRPPRGKKPQFGPPPPATLNLVSAIYEGDDEPYTVTLAFDRAIDVRITRIRKKIEADPAHPAHLKTVWGVGYRFEA